MIYEKVTIDFLDGSRMVVDGFRTDIENGVLKVVGRTVQCFPLMVIKKYNIEKLQS